MKTVILAVLSLTCALGQAKPYTEGSTVAAFKATDQHKKAYTFNPATTRILLVSQDMEAGKQANAALDKMGAKFLGKHHAVFLSNIHGMPAIGRMFALRKMRTYAHRIVLIDDAKLAARFPASPGKVTMLTLENGRVTDIRYWDPATQKPADALK